MEKDLRDKKKEFVAYLDDRGEEITGYFDILEINNSFVKLHTNRCVLIIPFHRILKIKLQDGANGF